MPTGFEVALDGSWNVVETTYTAVAGDVYLRPGMYRRMELTGAGDFEVRNFRVERLAGGPASATYTYDGPLPWPSAPEIDPPDRFLCCAHRL